jgi:predicted RNase H-like HicB family nuclease
MQYQIFIQNPQGSHFTASVIGLPACVSEGSTREEALSGVKFALEERLAQGEIVTLDLPGPSRSEPQVNAEHPWKQFAGMWANDPDMDEFLAEMKRMRQEEDQADLDHALDS